MINRKWMIRLFLEQRVICYIKVLKFVEFKIIYNDNKVFFYIKIVDYIDIICGEFIMFV